MKNGLEKYIVKFITKHYILFLAELLSHCYNSLLAFYPNCDLVFQIYLNVGRLPFFSFHRHRSYAMYRIIGYPL